MSAAEQVKRLEDLLARIEKNRDEPATRLRLAGEGVPMGRPSAPISARLDVEPPSTRDFGERPDAPEAPERTTLRLDEGARAPAHAEPPPAEILPPEAQSSSEALPSEALPSQALPSEALPPEALPPEALPPEMPEPATDPSFEVSEPAAELDDIDDIDDIDDEPTPTEEPVAAIAPEEAPEFVLDESSHDVFIEEDTAVASAQPSTVDIISEGDVQISVDAAPEIEAVTRPKPTLIQPEPVLRDRAVAAAAADPITEPRPDQPTLELSDAEPDVEPPDAEPPDAEPPDSEPPDSEPMTAEVRTPRREVTDEVTADSALDAVSPPTAVPPTTVSVGPARGRSEDPDEITTKRKAKADFDAALRRPPPLPSATTQVSEPPDDSLTAPSLAAVAEPEPTGGSEWQAPPAPAPAPVLAARGPVTPVVTEPELIETAKVAEMIGEVPAPRTVTFGGALDATLSLGFD